MHAKLLPLVQQNIATHGQHLFGVFPTQDDPGIPFVYTIGNALKGLPELIIVGPFDAQVVGSILNHVGMDMRKTGEVLPDVVDIGGKFPLRTRLATATARSRWTVQAGQYLGRENYEVQQLLLCDPAGVYPGEPGINPAYDVPLI